MSGGNVDSLDPYGFSTVNLSGGGVSAIFAHDSSTTNISGGNINGLSVFDSSKVNVSGGSIDFLYARDYSTTTFQGRNFHLTGWLTLDDERVLGIGMLFGEWMDGTPFAIDIRVNQSTATIRVIPEPATVLLLGLGGLVLRKRK